MNSWKLGMFAALCAAVAVAGCGDDDDSTSNNGGSSGSGGSTAGTAGSSAGKGGNTNGGSSAGNTQGGTAGKGGNTTGGNAGTAGKGGSAGNGGSTVAGGAGGEGGTAEGGMGGAGGAPECMEEAVGGAPDAAGGAGGAGPAATTAVVLVDNITVKNGNTVVKAWTFDDGNDIADLLKGDIGDKWLRPPFDQGGGNLAYSSPYAHDVFSKCDGKPAGSLMNLVPFTDAAQYYKVGIGFAQADWSAYTVSADIKVVSGGNAAGACALQAALFVQDGAGDKTGAFTYLNVVDGWKTMTLTVPASTMVDHLFVNISDYTCL